MSNITKNLLVRGAQGNVGKQFVYRKRGKKTFIAQMPTIDPKATVSSKQETIRELFAAAAGYATGAIQDPALKAAYKKKAPDGASAYNVAFRDFLKAPVVKAIKTESYTGVAGSLITVDAKDDFRVATVKVSILTAAGVILEEGNAVLSAVNRQEWIYTTTQANAALPGTKITAIAQDLPGNKGTLEITL